METQETNEKTIEQIKIEYRTKAAMLGQIAYEYEMKKSEILEQMMKLNQEAYSITDGANEKN